MAMDGGHQLAGGGSQVARGISPDGLFMLACVTGGLRTGFHHACARPRDVRVRLDIWIKCGRRSGGRDVGTAGINLVGGCCKRANTIAPTTTQTAVMPVQTRTAVAPIQTQTQSPRFNTSRSSIRSTGRRC
eukprot:361751-Chlamydomonas_euryale.AAC.5